MAIDQIAQSGLSSRKVIYYSAQLFSFNAKDPANTFISQLTVTGSLDIIVPTSCEITNTSISVPMGDFPSNSFKGVGSTSTATDYKIPIHCTGKASIDMTFPGTKEEGTTGVIKLDSNNSAAGVGVQLLDSNGNPINTGTPTHMYDTAAERISHCRYPHVIINPVVKLSRVRLMRQRRSR